MVWLFGEAFSIRDGEIPPVDLSIPSNQCQMKRDVLRCETPVPSRTGDEESTGIVETEKCAQELYELATYSNTTVLWQGAPIPWH